MIKKFQPTPEMNELLVRTTSANKDEAELAAAQLAVALQTPLREGVLSGDIVSEIFTETPLGPGAPPEWPLDPIAPGTERDYVAYSIPQHGRIPEQHIEGDYIMIPTYGIGSSIDWLLRYAREARWDIVGRSMQVLEASFVKKKNDDGWHTLLNAVVERNIIVYDNAAAAGQFTKRVVSLGKTTMRRQGGGNSTSVNKGALSDLYLSPEAMEDIRDWGVDQIDEMTRREIFTAADGSLNRVFNVNLHDIDEFGENQEYQLYFTSTLGGSLASGDVELMVGVDKSKDDSFVMPVKQDVVLFEDPTLHRLQRAGYYGWWEGGFGILDNRRCIALSL